MRKRVFCCVLGLLLLTACGSNAGADGPDPIQLGEAMTAAAADLPLMSTVTHQSEDGSQLFRYLSDLDYSKVDGYYFSYAAGGTAEEIAVIRLKDAADASAAKESLERHRENRVGIFRFYAPEQVPMAEDGEIRAQGNVVVLAICANAPAVAQLLTAGQ